MMEIPFVKMHGAGNDFILIDDRDGAFPVDDYMRMVTMASRSCGIGCEGIILVQQPSRPDCAFKMRFFNPDGSEAEMCGNGARCVAAFARDIGIACSDTMRFETIAGDVEAEIVDHNLVRVLMPAPRDFGDDFVFAGVPHKIVVVENLAKTDVDRDGRSIRQSPEFSPDGTNVDFVTYRAPHSVSIRTYERGVEAETAACGTGSVAAAVIGVKDYGLEFPVRVKTIHGFELTVDGVFDGEQFSDVTLMGPVKRVFEGKIDFDALDIPNE